MSFIIILLPMILAAWSVLHLLQDHLAQDVSDQLQSDVSAASLYYQGQVDKVRSAISTIALDNMVKTTLRLDISGQLQKHLVQLAAQHQLDFLLIVDPEGYINLSSLSQSKEDVDLSEHLVIASAKSIGVTAGTILEQNASLLHLLERSGKEIDFKPVVLIEAAAPITLRDNLLGIVLGGVMVTDNQELVRGVQNAAGGDRVEIVAADRMAACSEIISQEKDRRQRFFPVRLDYENHRSPGVDNRVISPLDRIELVYDYRPLTTPGREPELALVVLRPVIEILQVFDTIRRAFFQIFGAALLLALVAAVFMSRFIANPLHDITRSMQKMRQGEKVEPLENRRNDEIGELITGFNDMALSLDARIMELGEEIGSRRKAEDMLAAESERLRAILQSMGDAVLAADIKGRVVLMNRVAEELTGWSMVEALGHPVHEVLKISGPDENEVAVDLLGWIRNKDQGKSPFRDLRLLPKNGEKKLIRARGSRLIDSNRQVLGTVLVIRDVTGRRRMEEELARGQKLESVGVLAGGIAHDFNNLLTAILGNLSLARMVSSTDDAHYRNIEDAEKASLRARELTQQLLTFSRGGSPVKNSVNLQELIHESAEFVARGSKVRLRFTADDKLWPVSVDRGQIGQVIDNLVINAIHAMPEGGFVDIDTINYQVEADSLLSLTSKRYVRITVKDYGAGISKEDHDRIFDPYFTTKELGNGLGLAICFSIVKKHGGLITVESEPGKGSIFYVYLPALDSDSSTETQLVDDQSRLSSDSSQRVLVMDDDEIVRSVVYKMLELLGYEVEEASDGVEAIRMYEQALKQGKRYDLVIMDLTIPGGMGGQEAVSRILKIDPGALAIVSSGYSSHEVMADYKKYGFVGVVVKPFRVAELARLLKEVLG
ncbi:MAG: ATP-binding protein [Thermodesulfobacteriota bacterium]|nr:ATP-binding protein [Thermodesulfobacteriota bacterium]